MAVVSVRVDQAIETGTARADAIDIKAIEGLEQPHGVTDRGFDLFDFGDLLGVESQPKQGALFALR